MAHAPKSPMHWPSFPDIPIYLDTGNNGRNISNTYGTTPTTPTTPEVVTRNRPTYLSPAHATAAPISPVEPSPTTTIETSSQRSVVWPIPEPPPEVVQQQQTRRPLLRFFPTDRPRVRLDGFAASTPMPYDPERAEKATYKHENTLKLDTGLGIQNGPPNAPSIRIQPPPFENEKSEPAPNIAQRIEERLWRWNASGNVMERWMLEIISWLISAICMGAIVAVLIVLRDQPASKWPFDSIGFTLNAFVSILSRIAGAALLLPVAEALGQLKWSWFIKGNSKKMWDFEMFDNASRGPWGAFLLLIHTRGKTIAALGALVTIFCLALDPFFQQVVAFPERWTLQNETSSIPRVIRYEPHYPVEFVNGEENTQYDQDILAVADTFFLGNGTQQQLYGNGTRPDIPLSCPTSRCTWPSYETLGMCSQCVEVPQLLTFKCMYTRVDWTSELNTTVSSYPNATVCGHFLNATSEAPVLMSGYMVDDNGKPFGEALLMRTLPLITNPLRAPLWGGSINFKHIRNPLENVLISSSSSRSQVFANKMPTLHECVVSWCVKTMDSSYLSGMYQENVTSTFYNDTVDGSPWITEFDPTDGGTWYDYIENVTISAPSTSANMSEYGWGVNNLTMIFTIMVFDRIFPAFTTAKDDTSTPLLRWRTGSPTEVRTRVPDFNPWLSSNNITNHMERLVNSITNAIRSSSSHDMISGQAFENEIYVSVRWAWLSLPFGLLLVSFVFLLATVIKSGSEKEVGIRKNSAIATLLYGLPDHYQKRLAKPDPKMTPRAKAKDLKVKLSPTTGWRVSGNVFTPVTPTIPRNLPPPGWI
ncbi:uncharacterized protein SETTUDRAFT_133621 [Exserohilum turcica Et28A]|uniref:DUF3176 domain containing protein n=1 Tax=Exserohilum turcicum (strain 28A) TaxID=671987 RepID=R0KG12_EXST2|nr:uncharacterized protein SETTUDRAFT_133621 [Exserohilum turcica Et28A]EOA91783.1 hypothetical protein SETTUDRAFT_133621 [Exserohilum turcica Et28A]